MSQQPHRCPVCNGKGTVPPGFYPDTTTDASRPKCRTCGGTGIVWGTDFPVRPRPVFPSPFRPDPWRPDPYPRPRYPIDDNYLYCCCQELEHK